MVISSTLSNPVFFLKAESNRCQTVLFQNHPRSTAKTADIWVPPISNSNVVDFWSFLTILCEIAVKKLIKITCDLYTTLPLSPRECCQNEPLQLMERVCRMAQGMLWDCVYTERLRLLTVTTKSSWFLFSFLIAKEVRASIDQGFSKWYIETPGDPQDPFRKSNRLKPFS